MSAQPTTAQPLRINKGEIGRHAYQADIPTLLLAIGVYGAFFTLTWFYRDLPWWAVLPLGASIVCLHGSLQHEAVHGYPFKSRRLNRWIVGWSLWLWIPFDVYVATHTRHHIDQDLTDPFLDPESNYLTEAQWAQMSPLHRWVRQRMRTLAGRILLGPGYFTVSSLRECWKDLTSGDQYHMRPWIWHFCSTGLLLAWVVGVCGIPVWAYVLMFAYPGTSMALVRSYAEHRAAPDEKTRSIICDAGPFWSFMFLYNNLHALHHAEPALAWYRRPARYRETSAAILEGNGQYYVPGYFAIARAYMFRPKEPIFHPYKTHSETIS
jgi:fatty acid desaturase